MEAIDYYRVSLRKIIESEGLVKRRIALDMGFEDKHFNEFIKGNRNFSEARRECIAGYLGTTYIDMLIKGRKLSGCKPESREIMELTPEIINNVLSIAAGFQKDIQGLRNEIKELAKEVSLLKKQCESTQKGLGRVDRHLKNTGTEPAK